MALIHTLSDGSSVRIAHVGPAGGRQCYRWDVYRSNGLHLAGDEDIRSGVGAPVDLAGTLGTFASFLGAWVDSFRYEGSENANLFPACMEDWAVDNSDELYVATMDVDAL